MSADNLIRSILFAGVGGQGIIKASDITCQAIMKAGLDVKKVKFMAWLSEGDVLPARFVMVQKFTRLWRSQEQFTCLFLSKNGSITVS